MGATSGQLVCFMPLSVLSSRVMRVSSDRSVAPALRQEADGVPRRFAGRNYIPSRRRTLSLTFPTMASSSGAGPRWQLSSVAVDVASDPESKIGAELLDRESVVLTLVPSRIPDRQLAKPIMD